MEDILASIRKIISEDEPVALESPEDSVLTEIVSSEFGRSPGKFVSDAVADLETPSLSAMPEEDLAIDPGSVDLNIDDVLAGLDDDLTLEPSIETAGMAADALKGAALDTVEIDAVDNDLLENVDTSFDADFETDDDILAFLDAGMSTDAVSSDSDASEDVDAVEDFVLPSSELGTGPLDGVHADTTIGSEDAEMDSLLDEILMMPEDEVLDFSPDEFESVETFQAVEMAGAADEPLVSEEESDLDLVKSLMADLTDDPDGLEADDDLYALLEIPEIDDSEAVFENIEMPTETIFESAVEAAEVDAEILAENDDILSNILDMTIEDELDAQPDDLEDLMSLDDVAAAEQDNLIANGLDLDTADVETLDSDIPDSTPSLSDIAAAAEADAVAVETNTMSPAVLASASAAATGAGLTALTAKASPSEDNQDVELSEDIPADVDNITAESSAIETKTETSHSLSSQETNMPVKAVKTDTILDEVTETATAGAFAELNSVVEDKAIFNERGPRIGDLVQEALRPMLKEWLDANLKGIVERAVTKEVKRISSGK